MRHLALTFLGDRLHAEFSVNKSPFLLEVFYTALSLLKIFNPDPSWQVQNYPYFLDSCARRHYEIYIACYCDPVCQCGIHSPLYHGRGTTHPSTADEIPSLERR